MGWQETPWGRVGPGMITMMIIPSNGVRLPVYGNFIRWNQQKSPFRSNAAFEETATVSSSPEISWKVRFSTDSLPKEFLVKRLMDSNVL